jgi:hypothetical protein
VRADSTLPGQRFHGGLTPRRSPADQIVERFEVHVLVGVVAQSTLHFRIEA